MGGVAALYFAFMIRRTIRECDLPQFYEPRPLDVRSFGKSIKKFLLGT